MAPSGRTLSAAATGTIAFTAKVSGVPDLLLRLSAPGGVQNIVSQPVFHPCVRLRNWKDRPGELSFVPPDGRFVLAGYEVDLLGDSPDDLSSFNPNSKAMKKLNLPVSLEVRTGLGPTGCEFDVRVTVSSRFQSSSAPSSQSSSLSSSFPRTGGLGSRTGLSFGSTGTSTHPVLEGLVVHVPLPQPVKNIGDLKVSRGETQYAPGDRSIEWRIGSKEIASLMASSFGGQMEASAALHAAVVGSMDDADEEVAALEVKGETWEYDDMAEGTGSYQSSIAEPSKPAKVKNDRTARANKILMPASASVSFSVKGWMASGVKVDSLNIDPNKSKGLGAGVTPYKGVKYLTVSKQGIEIRC